MHKLHKTKGLFDCINILDRRSNRLCSAVGVVYRSGMGDRSSLAGEKLLNAVERMTDTLSSYFRFEILVSITLS